MNITILQENLHKALTTVSKALSGKPQLPILNNVLLKTQDGKLFISATNLETTINRYIGAKVDNDGEITIAAKPFSEFIASLPPEKTTLVLQENNLIVECGRFTANFVTTPASEFPPLPQKKDAVNCSFKTSIFKEAISFAALAASTDESRPILTGIKMFTKDDEVVFAATDGFRLSVISRPTSAVFDKGIIVPARSAQEGVRLAEGEEDIVLSIVSGQNQLFFTAGESELITRLIEGEFPNYEKIIPKSTTIKVIFDRQEVLSAVKSTSIFARTAANMIRFKIVGDELEIGANAAGVGSGKTTVSIEKDGGDGEIAFNARFLLDLLSNLKEEKAIFEMTGALNPGVFKSPTDTSLLHIIMPVRVQT